MGGGCSGGGTGGLGVVSFKCVVVVLSGVARPPKPT